MRTPFALGLALVAALWHAAPAAAAPQILGLIASRGAIPLSCADGVCRVELSAFCLEKGRQIPLPGTRYGTVGEIGLRLAVTAVDGSVRYVPAADYVDIESARMHTAVTVSVSGERLAALGAASVALEVGDGVTLVPAAAAGDALPHTAADVAIASGPLRDAATRLVDQGGEAVDAARLLARLINALPPEDPAAVVANDALWREVVEPNAGRFAESGVRRAEELYLACRRRAEDGAPLSLRGCLETHHDALIQDLNSNFWKVLELAS